MIAIKDTVFLPQTDFPMRGNLAEREPEILKFWQKMDIYAQLRQKRANADTFILHEGPPFANGNIHIGHALNRILKDIVVRSQSMLGKNTPVIPGWDCHGLPIEWKIEEQYRDRGQKKEDIDVHAFRKECQNFAYKWIRVQSEELQRLGLMQDWKNPYTTMNPLAESIIVQELGKFLCSGALYRGFSPVMWSVVEKTALAEAEIEYKDHVSTSVYVGFDVQKSPISDFVGAKVVIWTTTSWTLPANRAIAYNPDIDYVMIEVSDCVEGSFCANGQKFLVAAPLREAFVKAAGISHHKNILNIKGAQLGGVICSHPFKGQGYDFDVPLLPAEYVTTEAGTGFVHTAPSHGPDDFILGKTFGLEVPDLVSEEGFYRENVPLFSGYHIFKVEPLILDTLKKVEALFASAKIRHSYPHSWRSKAPIIYRATPQWFISMEKTNLRTKAIKATHSVRWVPESGQRRLQSMIENRPDWCISRQRLWGVPLTLFVHKKTGEVLRDEKVHSRIVDAVKAKGCEVWFSQDPLIFLAPDYSKDDYEPIYDIIDVWFESGSSQSYVLNHVEGQRWPADVYIEGSDQHRGWFQSSLFVGCESHGGAPYKTVLTHGFTLDDKGQKMSKSLGNVVSPLEVAHTMGVDILRLWVASSDVSDDVRVGPETLKHCQDIYRRYRNTLRYLLGALHGYVHIDVVDMKEFPVLERYILHKIYELNQLFLKCVESYEFLNFYNTLHNFCAVDLSSFYFDIRKDRLYCDKRDTPERQATLYTLSAIFENLIRWLAPVLCFTSEEAWQHRHGSSTSIHLQSLLHIPESWCNEVLGADIDEKKNYRRVITGALEQARNSGLIGSSLQAHVTIFDPRKTLGDADFWAEFCIVSSAKIIHEVRPIDSFHISEISDIGVVVAIASGDKCERCWKVTFEVGQNTHHPTTCNRCSEVLSHVL